MTLNERPTVVIACRVMQDLLTPRLPAQMAVTYLDILLHNTPKKLAAALQAELDGIEQPSNAIIGYGLCGNGLAGVRAGRHTLIVPRTHDCVAIFLGSHQRYVQRFFANPNSYYLTRGWLEANDDPLHDYLEYLKEYDEETADYLVEMKYHHYRRLCMVGFSLEELDACRPMAKAVADFCAERWGMVYEEITGSIQLLDSLLAMPSRLEAGDSEFVVVPPDGVIEPEQFMRSGERVPASAARKSFGA